VEVNLPFGIVTHRCPVESRHPTTTMSAVLTSSQSPKTDWHAHVDVTPGTAVTQEQLVECASLFSNHYGIWADSVKAPLKPGARVKMNAAKLRKECLGNPEHTVLITSYLQDKLIGHAFATKWQYGEDVVGWVTQLVVDSSLRKRYVATNLLQNVKHHPWFDSVTIVGVASSHPAACHAVAKLARLGTAKIDLDFVAKHAEAILACTSVAYLKTAQLHGSLFGEESPDGAVSLANTNFFVDHKEPEAALEEYLAEDKWHLGRLRDGHEYIVIVPLPRRD